MNGRETKMRSLSIKSPVPNRANRKDTSFSINSYKYNFTGRSTLLKVPRRYELNKVENKLKVKYELDNAGIRNKLKAEQLKTAKLLMEIKRMKSVKIARQSVPTSDRGDEDRLRENLNELERELKREREVKIALKEEIIQVKTELLEKREEVNKLSETIKSKYEADLKEKDDEIVRLEQLCSARNEESERLTRLFKEEKELREQAETDKKDLKEEIMRLIEQNKQLLEKELDLKCKVRELSKIEPVLCLSDFGGESALLAVSGLFGPNSKEILEKKLDWPLVEVLENKYFRLETESKQEIAIFKDKLSKLSSENERLKTKLKEMEAEIAIKDWDLKRLESSTDKRKFMKDSKGFVSGV